MKNHFIPEFYFAPWLDPTGHLVQFGWRRGRLLAELKTPGQICYKKDLTTFQGPIDSERLHAVEHWLSKEIDNKAAPIMKTILSSGVSLIDAAEKSHMAHFIMSLIVRSPENVQYLVDGTPDDLERNIGVEDERIRREIAAAGGSSEGPTLLEYASTRYPGYIENAGRVMISEIIADRHYGERLFAMKWWTADFSGTSVVPQFTSDRAVVCLGAGFNDPRAIVVLPLSPQRVLYATGEDARTRLQGFGKGRLGLLTIQAVLKKARVFGYGASGSNMSLVERHLTRPSNPS